MMTQWIRWWGVGLLFALVLLWWLCMDFIVKAVITSVGTEVNGAKVELEHAQLDLFPARLTLTGLQVTDASDPMHNLLVAEQITASLDTLQLLSKKIIADTMVVSGLQFNTVRKTSGAIDARVLSSKNIFNSDNLRLGGSVPGLALPDVNELVDKEKDQLKKEYDKINTELKALEQQWNQRLDDLPDKKTIAGYKQRIKTLKKGNFLQQLAGLESLKEDIDKDRNTIKKMRKQLKQDLEKVKHSVSDAAGLPKKHVNHLLSELGMGDNALDNLATGIMSGRIKQWLQQGLAMIRSGDKRDQDVQHESALPTRGEGVWIHFTDEEPLPAVLIRTARLDGTVSFFGQLIRFKGEAFNLTHQPDKWHKPATFTIDAASDTNTRLAIKGFVDRRSQQSKEHVEFRVMDVPLNDYALSDNTDLQVMAKKALANVNGHVSMTGNTIDLDVQSAFSAVDLQVKSTRSDTITSALISTLQGVRAFDLALRLTGTLANPAVTVSSDLDELLNNAVGETVKQEMQTLKDKLTTRLQAQMAPELQQISKQGDVLSVIDERLGAMGKELKSLTRGF